MVGSGVLLPIGREYFENAGRYPKVFPPAYPREEFGKLTPWVSQKRCVCDNGFSAFAPPLLTNAIHDDGILASTSFVVAATPLQSYGAVNRTS